MHIICVYLLCLSLLYLGFSLNLHTLGVWSTAHPNGLDVPNASMNPVKSTKDVLELMHVGLMNRAAGATALNERSSRSHRFYSFLQRFYFYYLVQDLKCFVDL